MRLISKILSFIIPVCLMLPANLVLGAGADVDYTYDQAKNRVEKQRYMENGAWVEFLYDDNGNIITKTVTADSAPTAPTGGSSATNGTTTANFSWAPSTDPDMDPFTYKLYLGTSQDLTTPIESNLTTASYSRVARNCFRAR